MNQKQDDDRPQVTKKEKKKKKKVKKSGLSFADDDPSEETENFKLKKSSRYLTCTRTITRTDSMISAYRVHPAASGRGLCGIDRLEFGITQPRVKLESPGRAKIERL